MDFKSINNAALAHLEELVHEVDSGAQPSGREWLFLNPKRADTRRGSAKINRDSGVWSDFASGDGGSDIVSWWAHCRDLAQGKAGQELASRFSLVAPGRPEKPWTGPKPSLEWVPMHDALDLPYKAPPGRPSKVWTYQDQESRALFQRPRYETVDKEGKPGKDVKWWGVFRGADGQLKWMPSAPPVPRPLYGLPDLQDKNRDQVLIVEGEKAADAARALFPRMAALTSGSATSAGGSAWEPLRGRQDVVLWPDHDDDGQSYAGAVTAQLKVLGVRLRVVQVPATFPPKWDLADPLPPGVTPADLQEMITKAPFWDGQEEAPKSAGLFDLVLSGSELTAMDIPPRETIVTPFIATGSLNMVYAIRGIGKTWFGMELCHAIVSGQNFFDWHVPSARRVLFIDGEMPTVMLQERFKLVFNGSIPDGLSILPSEALWTKDKPLNLNAAESQERIQALLDALDAVGRRPALIIIDNLSSLSFGADENDNSVQDTFLRWLMGLRHQGYAVLLVHHAGKGGDQRGASRREDFLDTSIRLSKPDIEGGEGAAFKIEFTKERGVKAVPGFLTVALEIGTHGEMIWTRPKSMPEYHWAPPADC